MVMQFLTFVKIAVGEPVNPIPLRNAVAADVRFVRFSLRAINP